MHSRPSLFEELSKHAGASVDTRAENAFNVGVKFLELLRVHVPDEKAFELMMKAWFRAIKDDDFTKFRRIYKKHVDGN